MSENNTMVVPTTKTKLCATITFNWFLSDAEKFEDDEYSKPVPATFKPLVNGKEAFGLLYDKIAAAKSSVDIAIWGFQPSMYFKRDGKSLCIGDLLIKKAMEGVKVRLLLWSMAGDIQTASEANLGGKPGVLTARADEGVTKEQVDYDTFWFYAISGELTEHQKKKEKYSTQMVEGFKGATGYNEELLRKAEAYYMGEGVNKELLTAFNNSPLRTNLTYKTRKVAKQHNRYVHNELPGNARGIGFRAPSHHQKTVLIDYEEPKQAVGFVMEHNMLDNYWDDSEHSLNTRAPHLGKNCVTPMQDVSSIVTGQVLWDINYNFCQSWDRQNNTQWGTDNIETDLMEQRKRFVRTDYQPNTKLGAEGKLLMAQIVRTYDAPDVEDIMQVYLKNIKQTTSYIYTENQYFRFPPLVSAFIEHWERMRGAGREGPIHWFAITNSSDAGIGKGTKTTNDMLRLLGRQDVMPNVAKAVREEELKWQLKILDIQETKVRNDALNYIPAAKPLLNQNLKTVEEQRQWVRQEMTRIEALKTKNADTADTADDNDETKETNLTRELGYELSDNPGIKAHICTLMPKDKTGKYVHTYKKQGKDEPAEVYVHSKVTIMDDVFTFIGSANLNTRSMQLDTELGILTECHESTQALRKRLWGLHTGNNPAANPEDMHNYQVTVDAFDKWQRIINANKNDKRLGRNPACALREFLRTDPTISRMD